MRREANVSRKLEVLRHELRDERLAKMSHSVSHAKETQSSFKSFLKKFLMIIVNLVQL